MMNVLMLMMALTLSACAFKESDEEKNANNPTGTQQPQTASYENSTFEPQIQIGWKKRIPKTDSNPERIELETFPRTLSRSGAPYTESYGASTALTVPVPVPESVSVVLRGNASLLSRSPLAVRALALPNTRRTIPSSLISVGDVDLKAIGQGRVEVSVNISGISALLSTAEEDQLEIKLELYDRADSFIASFLFSLKTLPAKIPFEHDSFKMHEDFYSDEIPKEYRKITTATKVLTLANVITLNGNHLKRSQPVEMHLKIEREITLAAKIRPWFNRGDIPDVVYAKKAYFLPITPYLLEQVSLLTSLKEPLKFIWDFGSRVMIGVYLEGARARTGLASLRSTLMTYPVECLGVSYRDSLTQYLREWGCDKEEALNTFECETPRLCMDCATNPSTCVECAERDQDLVLRWPPHYCSNWSQRSLSKAETIGEVRSLTVTYPEASRTISIRNTFSNIAEDPTTREVFITVPEIAEIDW